MATRTRFFFYPTPTQNLKNEQKASQESIRKIQFLPALLHQNSRILCKPAENQAGLPDLFAVAVESLNRVQLFRDPMD